MTKATVSWFLRVNSYAGTCAICGNEVGASDGFVQKNRDSGKWETLCDSCVREHGRVTPFVYLYNGEVRTVSAKSVVTGKVHDALECNRCHAKVAWVKGKSGKFYLANCRPKVQYSEDSMPGLRTYDFDAHDCLPFLKYRAEDRYRETKEKAETLLRLVKHNVEIDAAIAEIEECPDDALKLLAERAEIARDLPGYNRLFRAARAEVERRAAL